MWVGNLDGARQGCVIATTKQRAREVVRTGRTHFDGYWIEQAAVNESLEPEVLYTRKYSSNRSNDLAWIRGRCPL